MASVERILEPSVQKAQCSHSRRLIHRYVAADRLASNHGFAQVYRSEKKLEIDIENVIVQRKHFVRAMQKVKPAGKTQTCSCCCLLRESHTCCYSSTSSWEWSQDALVFTSESPIPSF